jgi:hypothetical protein
MRGTATFSSAKHHDKNTIRRVRLSNKVHRRRGVFGNRAYSERSYSVKRPYVLIWTIKLEGTLHEIICFLMTFISSRIGLLQNQASKLLGGILLGGYFSQRNTVYQKRASQSPDLNPIEHR